ncbi:type II secretion system protein [uncultured Pseudomonas sp.]|uniref:PulJ/GspJ family protein n=1 Tax=uncultured Pseudomonas sp. TaxID=114707 RepID=UPI0030D94317|tara:strand:+ start:21529 stop:22398 length:870 start_codon:yes stop_codon:yes gene_type:complete
MRRLACTLSASRTPVRVAYTGHGFTLVELVMVIALSGLVAVMIGTVMSRPMQGFVDQSRRAELVDLAATAVNRMARDVRLAVPNSVRINGGVLELLRAPSGGRYRANLAGGVLQDPPVCAASPCTIPFAGPLQLNELALPANLWMVIYNVGSAGAGNNVWTPAAGAPSVISPRVSISVQGSDLRLTGAAINGFRFRYASPQHRFFLADQVVGYRCANGRLWRGEFDSLAANYDYSAAATVVDQVDCANSSFTYTPGTNIRSGLVTIRLTLSANGESISLLQQVHVDNAP